MIGTSWEEKQKDEILQQINDLLEKYEWGGACDRMVVKVIFEGKFNVKPIIVQNKESEIEKRLDKYFAIN